MTYQELRDEFAVAALKLVGPEYRLIVGDPSATIASRCYDIVDAMMVERRKRKAPDWSPQPAPQRLRRALDLAVGALKSTTIIHREKQGLVTAEWKTTVWDGLGEEQKHEIEEALKCERSDN